MEFTRTLMNLCWVILVLGGIIWSIFSLSKSVLKFIYTFFTKTIKIRNVNKQIVTAVVKNKKYYKPRSSTKPSPTDMPPIYELIVEYEDIEYIITTNKKTYNNYEINHSIDLLLKESLDSSKNVISYNFKIYK